MLRHITISLALAAGVVVAHAAPEVVPLGVTVNDQRSGDIFGWQDEHGLWLPLSALQQWGLKAEPTATIQGKPVVSLKSVADKVKFDESEFRLIVTLTPEEIARRTEVSLLKKQVQDITVAPGLVVDYELGAGRAGNATSFSGRTRSHISLGGWQLLDERSVQTYKGEVHSSPWRTTLRKDWLERNLRLDVGTLTTPSPGLSYWPSWRGVGFSSAYFGQNSLQLSRSSASLSTAVTLPSTADIYVNGVKQASYPVAPGMFDVQGLRGYSAGAAQVKAVIRDAFGRETVLEEPRYIGDATLASGVHEFSYQLGREEYAPQGKLQLRGAHRLGLTPDWTLTGRVHAGEESKTLQAGAVTQVARVGEIGMNVLLGRDKSGHTQRGYSLSHDYRASTWSVGTVLSSSPRPVFTGNGFVTMNVRDLSVQASCASSLGQFQARASASRFADGKRATELEVGWSKQLNTNLLAQVAARNSTVTGSSAHLMLVWRPSEGYSVNSFTSSYKGELSQQLSASKERGTGPTLWRLDAQAGKDYRALTGAVDHDTGIAVLQASVHTSGTSSAGRVAVRGGLLASPMGVALTSGRSNSAVLVETGDLAGVGVFRNGTQVGVTDERGRLWVSDVTGYEETRITLNEPDIPMDYWYAGAGVKPVRPGPGSVVPMRFDIRAVRSTAVWVQECAGPCVPARDVTLVFQSEGGVSTQAAVKNGTAHVEGLLTGSHRVFSPDHRCAGELNVAKTGDVNLQIKCSDRKGQGEAQ